MPINLTTPIVVPSQTFDLVAVKFLRIDWQDLNGKVTANYTLKPYFTDDSSVNHESPTTPINGRINDLFAEAASRSTAGKPALATALTAVLAALQEIEHEKGTI